jgi:hypothetical protein
VVHAREPDTCNTRYQHVDMLRGIYHSVLKPVKGVRSGITSSRRVVDMLRGIYHSVLKPVKGVRSPLVVTQSFSSFTSYFANL